MTVAKMKPPFRAEHVGSLKRPERLQRAREKLLGPQPLDNNLAAHDNAELRAIEDETINEVIKAQEDVGLNVVTDGEFRRRTWWTDFILGFEGTAENTGTDSPIVVVDKTGHRRPLPSVVVTGKVEWTGSVVRDSFTYLAARTTRTPKLTIPAPMQMHYFMGGRAGIDRKAYPDLDAFWDDVATAYRKEIDVLAAAGCRYLQLDDVTLAFLCDPKRRDEVKTWGHEPFELIKIYVAMFNKAVAKRPADMTPGFHACRGNAGGHWGAEGGYEPVADLLFNTMDVDAYFLEYDTPRAGGFEPLRFLPKHKTLVLGLISSKEPDLEKPDALKRRIDEAAKFAPLDQLALSPQCGFASNYIGNPVTADDQRRKLELVVDVARAVWGNA